MFAEELKNPAKTESYSGVVLVNLGLGSTGITRSHIQSLKYSAFILL